METNALYALAGQSGVTVDFFPLPQSRAVSLNIDGRDYVALDKTVSGSEERVCLAHELGHCLMSGFYSLNSPPALRKRAEKRAKQWTIKTLVPISELKRALSAGICDTASLADHFGVTVNLMEQAMLYYSNN